MKSETTLELSVLALREALVQACLALDLSLTGAQTDALLGYLALIQKWNRVYNLTAVRNPADMLTHHLLDSLAVVRPLRRQLQEHACANVRTNLLDVGSGAGLPGVVIAICCPDMDVVCVDTVAKKAAFIQQVAVTLKLPQLRGMHARVESLQGPFDIVVSRAFASLVDFTNGSCQALGPQGVWLAMKGKHPAQEIAALPANRVQVFHVEPIAVPGLHAERCLVWMRPAPG